MFMLTFTASQACAAAAGPSECRRAPPDTLLWLVSAERAKSSWASSLLSLAARVALPASCPAPNGLGMLQEVWQSSPLVLGPECSCADCVRLLTQEMLMQQPGTAEG